MQKAVFYLAALRIGAVEHGDALVRDACSMSPLHLTKDDVGLVRIAIGGKEGDRVAHLFLAEDLLCYLFAIVANQAAGGIHDGLRRAIIALEFEEACAGIGLAEM